MPLTASQVAAATGCPADNVSKNWPLLVAALEEFGILSVPVEIAAAATVAIETARTFRPINEYGGEKYFTEHYEGRTDLGNVRPGDGARYHGRGFVQITGRANYRAMSHVAGCDLEEAPERALEAGPAARILASYFASRRVAEAASEGDWIKVRKRVNGGLNGWAEFKACVDGLLQEVA